MPNITLGIIGSGQLGSLLCQAAKKLNIKTIIISDDKEGPAQNFLINFYLLIIMIKKIKEFITKADIVTYEFENIPIKILKNIDKKRVLPKPYINQIVQNRKLEKTFINNLGIKTTEWAFINSSRDIKKSKTLARNFKNKYSRL